MSVRRPTGSKWRKTAFAALCERDGAACQECRVPHKIVWRNTGYETGELWGPDPWETYRYTGIRPTSNLEVDHRVALHLGGTNDHSNLWLLCRACHQAKTSGEQSYRLKRIFAEARV